MERPEWQLDQELFDSDHNAVTAAVHDRMPVILNPHDYDLWLDPAFGDVAAVSQMLKADDARLMRCYPVSTRINHAANDDPQCAMPVELKPPPQGLLFARRWSGPQAAQRTRGNPEHGNPEHVFHAGEQNILKSGEQCAQLRSN